MMWVCVFLRYASCKQDIGRELDFIFLPFLPQIGGIWPLIVKLNKFTSVYLFKSFDLFWYLSLIFFVYFFFVFLLCSHLISLCMECFCSVVVVFCFCCFVGLQFIHPVGFFFLFLFFNGGNS